MAISTTLNNVKIRGNTISGNPFLANYYSRHISVSGSALISENYLTNPISNATDMLLISNGSCQVINNKFIRSSANISNYIGVTSTNDNTITDNIFDSSVTNVGNNEILISDVNGVVLSDRNKNQIYTKLFYWNKNNLSHSTDPSSYTAFLPVGSNNILPSIDLNSTQYALGNFDIPKNMTNGGILKSISATIQARNDTSTLTSGPNNMTLTLSDSPGTNAISTTVLDISSGANWTTLKNNATTLTITDFSAIDQKKVNRLYFSNASGITIATAQGALSFSPITVKYTY